MATLSAPGTIEEEESLRTARMRRKFLISGV